VKAGIVAPSVMLRKLAAYCRQNQLDLALQELGRIERTLFMLDWLESPELRRGCHAGLKHDKVLFILEPSDQAKAAIGKRVTVIDHPDGRLSIRYRGIGLAYRTFDKLRQVDQGAIADNKRLSPILAMIRDEQLRREPQHRSQRAPRRRDQRDPRLFKVG
jgi:hypothetical protein